MIAISEAWRAGLLRRKHWLPNIVSGVIVGVVALPLSMAFAIASGVKPEHGLYTAIIAGLLVSLFGGSRLQIAGPTGAFIVILADIVARYGVVGMQIAALMAGVMLLLFGLARMGAVIRYIPTPVVVGFTAGIGVIIWVGQWPYFFGLSGSFDGAFHQKLWHLLQALPQLDMTTSLLALLSLALIVYAPRLRPLARVPGPLVALVVVTLIQSLFGFSTVETIGSKFGQIPNHLPTFALPEFPLSRLPELIAPAFTIAMLGAIESLLCAVVADRMVGTRHDSNQELIGQGLANIVAPLFGGIAATGAIARTATNIRNGGTSPLAGIVHVVTLVLILLILAPLAANVPLATLAAILFFVAWNMSEVRTITRLFRRAPTADVFILVATFLLTVFTDLVVAVNIGVILAMLHFMRRMADSVKVNAQTEAQVRQEFSWAPLPAFPPGLHVYAVEGPFFFGAAEAFDRVLPNASQPMHTLLIRMRHVPFVDATGLQALEDVITNLTRRHVCVLMVEVNARVLRKMGRMGLIERVGGGDHILASVPEALLRLTQTASASRPEHGARNTRTSAAIHP